MLTWFNQKIENGEEFVRAEAGLRKIQMKRKSVFFEKSLPFWGVKKCLVYFRAFFTIKHENISS